MNRKRLVITVASATALVFCIIGSASADSSPNRATKIPCSVFFGGDVSGDVVVTSSGNANGNCNFPAPATGGGSQVVACSQFGLGEGNFVFTPSGHIEVHCSSLPF